MRSVGPVEWSGTLDPNGIDTGLQDPFPADGGGNATGESEVQFLKPGLLGIEQSGYGCTVDGAQYDCRFLTQEAVVPCPNNDCGRRRVDIDVRYSGGRGTQHIAGLVNDPFFDVNHTWTGFAAQEAARAFNGGIINGFQGFRRVDLKLK